MMNQDELVLDDDHRAVSTARRFVAERLSSWGWTDAVDDAELCTSELVTNAMLHAHTQARLLVRADDDAVRVEVHDGSRNLPAHGPAAADAMTGRGLLLIESLASAWGVEPDPDGKSVWFELCADGAGGANGLSAEDLLNAWDVDDAAWGEPSEAGPTRFHVSLGDVPTALLLDASSHVDNLVRELTLATAGEASHSSAGPPAALAEIVDSVVCAFVPQLGIRSQAQAAAAQGDERVRLEFDLPLDAAAAGEDYLRALDEADDYCRAARLLTLESPAGFRVFRQWYVEQLAAQLRAASAGRTVPAQTFEARLLEELACTAVARRTAERNSRLQRLTAVFAGALTAESVAAAVLDEGVPALGATAAGLLVPDGNGRLSFVASVGYDRQLMERITAGDVGELPTGVALATGEAVWVESREERDLRFPALASLAGGSVSLCVVPLAVAERRLGILRFGFKESRLFGEEERDFILSLAGQAAQALDRARLYAEERAARRAAEAAAARLARLHGVGARWSTTGQGAPADDAATDERRSAPRSALPDEWASLAYRSVLDELSDAVVVADTSATIRYVNRATEELVRAAPGELTELPLSELVPPRFREAHFAGVSRFLATRQPVLIGRSVRVPALRRDGTEVEVELKLTTAPLKVGPTGVADDILLVASLRDVEAPPAPLS